MPATYGEIFPDIKQYCGVLDYVYIGTKDVTVKQFEEELSVRFELELMGQAHWYLSTCITQLANFDITIHQTRYCNPSGRDI
jgi:hypothetical protein